MAITSERMSEILQARKLELLYQSKTGNSPAGWVARTVKGQRTHREPQNTPELAVEAAEAWFQAAEAAEAALNADRAIAALQRGRYYLLPREETAPRPIPGPPISRIVFDGYLPDKTITIMIGEESYIRAVNRMEEIVNARNKS